MMKTIAITSGKGGTGKTTIAANLAISLSQAGHRVVLFDADLQLANLDVMLAIQPEFNLQHVVAEEKTLREILCSGPGGIRVASGGSGIPMLMNAGPKRMNAFLGQLASLGRDTDYLIFDTGAGLDNKVLTFLKLAQEVMIVTTPDPTSVTDAYATIKTIFRRCPEPEISIVVNQVTGAREGEQIFGALSGISYSYLKRSISYLGHVRQDFQAAAATKKRRPFMTHAASCWAANDVRALGDALALKSARGLAA